MKPPVERNVPVLLFNPFAVVAGSQALLLGIAAILLAGVIGYFSSAQFDGVLDLHPRAQGAFWPFLADGVVDWACPAVVLLAIGRMASRTPFRSIDLFGTQALARWPSIVSGLAFGIPAYRRYLGGLLARVKTGDQIPSHPFDAVIFGTVTLGILGLVCWMVALMYKSYCVSCNLRGGKSVGTFIAGLIIAEALSKVALYWLVTLATR